MQYLRDVSEMSCGTMAIMQMRLQQDSSQQDSSNHRNVRYFLGGLDFSGQDQINCMVKSSALSVRSEVTRFYES